MGNENGLKAAVSKLLNISLGVNGFEAGSVHILANNGFGH